MSKAHETIKALQDELAQCRMTIELFRKKMDWITGKRDFPEVNSREITIQNLVNQHPHPLDMTGTELAKTLKILPKAIRATPAFAPSLIRYQEMCLAEKAKRDS